MGIRIQPVGTVDLWLNLVTTKVECVSSNPAKGLFICKHGLEDSA